MNISILQDSCIVEEDEQFIVVLNRVSLETLENRILLDITEGNVIITDDDCEWDSTPEY